MAHTMSRKDEKSNHMDQANDKLKEAGQAGGEAADKAKDAVKATGAAIGEAADAGAAAVGGGMKSLAGTIEKKGPQDGMLGDATSAVAKTLEQGGKYLEKQGVSGMAEDVGEMIKKNPIPAVLVGVGIGFLLGSLFRS